MTECIVTWVVRLDSLRHLILYDYLFESKPETTMEAPAHQGGCHKHRSVTNWVLQLRCFAAYFRCCHCLVGFVCCTCKSTAWAQKNVCKVNSAFNLFLPFGLFCCKVPTTVATVLPSLLGLFPKPEQAHESFLGSKRARQTPSPLKTGKAAASLEYPGAVSWRSHWRAILHLIFA